LSLLLALLLLGPAQTIAGKYAPRPEAPLPRDLPADVDGLCALIEAGHATAPLFAALGEALLARGDAGLAYRAFDRAHRLGHGDPVRLQQRKDACGRVPDAVIAEEEKEARIWVDALESFRRGGGADLEEFYARYGRPEESLEEVVRGRRLRFALWVAAVVFGGAGAGILLIRRRRRA
jgi:hypothetical protein